MGKKNKQKKRKKKNLPKELPEKFVERLTNIVGSSTLARVMKTFVDKPTTFRVNTIKAKKKGVDAALKEQNYKTKHVSWYDHAYILQNQTKRGLTELEIYKEGKIYIQSLASMVPPLILDPKPGEKVLDLTAAPGSKTSQIAALMEKRGELVANELNKVRFFRLQHNMQHLGVLDPQNDWEFIMRMEDGSALCKEYENYFDKILVDAPCSGEARFIDGYPKSYGYWSEHKIKQVAYRQHKLLMAAWFALKPGGVLVYSTCTMAPEENEARISKLIERFGEEVKVEQITLPQVESIPPIVEWKRKTYHKDVAKTFRMLPTAEVEGFYVARLRKVG